MTTDLRLGRWQDVLADVGHCDSLICDPPYSARVHEGFVGGDKSQIHGGPGIEYEALGELGASLIADSFSPRVARWAAIFCDHVAFQWHEAAWSECGWQTFAPVVMIRTDAIPRLCGDGPTCNCDYLMIARRRTRDCMDGARPGWYLAKTPRGAGIVGTKPIDVMRALVRDYSRPGDLVVDPFAGSGTTALACAIEGRRCITSEQDPKHYEIARRRLAAGFTGDMFADQLTGE